jgi:hypothetical protein
LEYTHHGAGARGFWKVFFKDKEAVTDVAIILKNFALIVIQESADI